MKSTVFLPFLFAISPLLPAQDQQQQPPNPKTKAHDALASFAGEWQTTCKSAAMPGVPGMEQAQESTGTERTDVFCNGLWMKSSIDSTFAGKPFQGVWIAGYDPFAKKYMSVWVSSHDEPDSIAEGSYDEKTKTWTFSGKSPHGPFRSVFAFKDADRSVETCYLTGADGKEAQCMEITRTRTKPGAPKDATAAKVAAPSNELKPLLDGVGSWDAAVKWGMKGQPATEEKCTEQVVAICEGKWTWSTFKGRMMGMPFEGHALCGYDATQKKYVSYWFDSMAATWMRTLGTYDAAKGTITMTGPCLDEHGKPGTVQQVCVQPDKDTRKLDMTFKTEAGTMEMSIQYKRTKG